MKKKLTSAVLQLGAAPPFVCVDIPVRMHGEDRTPQVKFDRMWSDYEYDRPGGHWYWWLPRTLAGVPVAGIATTWEIDRG